MNNNYKKEDQEKNYEMFLCSNGKEKPGEPLDDTDDDTGKSKTPDGDIVHKQEEDEEDDVKK